MLRKEFEALIERTVAELPRRFREKLENLAIIVEHHPSEELLDRMEIGDDETLFGLYDGVPLTERGHFDVPFYPDRILLFQGPIEEACKSPEEIQEEVRITLIHEIGHFFGFDDESLEERGYD